MNSPRVPFLIALILSLISSVIFGLLLYRPQPAEPLIEDDDEPAFLSPYASCQSPKQQAYMLARQKQLDEERDREHQTSTAPLP